MYEHLKSIKKNKGNIKIDSINDELHKRQQKPIYEPLKRFFDYSLMFKTMCKSKLPPLSRFCKTGGSVKNTMSAYKYLFFRETYDIVEVGNVN